MIFISSFKIGVTTAAILFGLVAMGSGQNYDWIRRSCTVESWDHSTDTLTNVFRIGNCAACFNKITDPLSPEGLELSQTCTATFLPQEQKACSEQIAALNAENYAESEQAVKDCFKVSLRKIMAEYCLSISSSEDVIESLTDGTICVMGNYKNVTDFVHFIHQVSGIPDDESENESTEINLKDYMNHKLFPRFYCQASLGKDAETLDSCYECFETAVAENKDDKLNLWKEVAQCSEAHLIPYFEECQSGLVTLSENSEADPKPVDDCFQRGVYR